MNRIAICLVFVIFLGCQKSDPASKTAESSTNSPATETMTADEQAPSAPSLSGKAKSKAMAAKKALFTELSGRLMEVMSSQGPAAAIEVCSKEASEIAVKVGKQQGVKIGRTALKLRNAKNLPPDWAKPLLKADADKPQFVTVDDQTFGALLPIVLQPQCMTCHGPLDKLSAEVKDQLVQLYPKDTATGFQTGDLRGWFWVEVPLQADESPEATVNDQAMMQYGKLL